MLKKGIIGVILAALIIAAFFAGGYVKEQKYIERRNQRCATLVSFAIDKAENHNLSDRTVMQALVSNVYAAYEICDDTVLAERLHHLWNALISESDGCDATVVLQSLNDILQILHADN